MAILADLKDPRVADVTVTYVEVSPDMRHAKIHVSVMGDEAKQNLCLHGLQNSSGYLQKKIAKRVDTRYTPRLHFELDMAIKKSIEISQILSDVLPDPMSLSDEPSADVLPSEGSDENLNVSGATAPEETTDSGRDGESTA